jgi:hypothetical protein
MIMPTISTVIQRISRQKPQLLELIYNSPDVEKNRTVDVHASHLAMGREIYPLQRFKNRSKNSPTHLSAQQRF